MKENMDIQLWEIALPANILLIMDMCQMRGIVLLVMSGLDNAKILKL